MPDQAIAPGTALLLFGAALLLLVLLAWPRRGVVARVRRLLAVSERTQVEDAVKYLYHAGERGHVVTDEALAGSLEIRRTGARDLLDRLAHHGLAETHAGGHRLTASGRRDALRVVRSHRLLERYLADRTGIGPDEWHEVAEQQEHALSDDDVEALAAAMGQPRFDPHGDPIPTASGELPDADGVALDALMEGEAGVVAHLEDEPREGFDRLQALGFTVGMPLVLRARDGRTVRVAFDGREVEVPRLLAQAVSVSRRATVDAADTARAHTLADLAPGTEGRVRRISWRCQGAQRRRLLDLGVVPGTRIRAELPSVGGDPVAYRIRGALIALRRQQAAWIELEAAA